MMKTSKSDTHGEIRALDDGNLHVVSRWTNVLVLLVGEYVETNHVNLGVAVLSGFRSRHLDYFARTSLSPQKKIFRPACGTKIYSHDSRVRNGLTFNMTNPFLRKAEHCIG